MLKHFFFDMDNTLTRSRSEIAPEHIPIFLKLTERADVIVVTGGQKKQIEKQLSPALSGHYSILAQNGNYAETKDGRLLWQRTLSPSQKKAVVALIERMKEHAAITVKDEGDLIEDRGCSVCYSVIGHHEDVSKKEQFDPDHAKRIALLAHFKEDVEKLQTEHNIEVRSGGTTTLDFFESGKNKGYNVAAFIAELGWNKDDAMYIGDALFPGGNDETVIGIIETKSVKDYHETYQYLQSILP